MPRRQRFRPILVVIAIVFAVGVVLPIAAFAKEGGGGSGHGGNNGDSGGGSRGDGGDDDGDNSDDGGGRGRHGDERGDDSHGGGGGEGQGRGRNRNGGYIGNWDNSGSTEARGAVSQGMALPLNRVMSVVRQAVPGRVLDVDLQQSATGVWVYKFLVFSSEGAYSEVYVDALSRRIVRVRER